MNFLIFLIIFLVLIELITLIHESGHLWIAKMNHVRVAEFSLGFGPLIFQLKRKDTTYSLRWLPLGGYVSVLSDDVINEIEKIKRLNPTPVQVKQIEKKMGGLKIYENYSHQTTIEQTKISKRVLFALGGVFFNFISIFVALTIAYSTYGKSYRQDDIVIAIQDSETNKESYIIRDLTYIPEASTSEEDWITLSSYDEMSVFLTQPEDYNLAYQDFEYGGEQYSNVSPVILNVDYINNNNQVVDANGVVLIPENISLLVFILNSEAGGPLESTTVSLLYTENQASNNFIEYTEMQPLTGFSLFLWAFLDSFVYLWYGFLWLLNFFSFGALFSAMNIHLAASTVSPAFFVFLRTWVFIMVASSSLIIVFNLLPIPPLDGWRVTEYSYEGIKKKKISKKTQSTIMKAGWGILFVFFFLGLFI